jgi:hypothetical protein
VRRVHVDDHQPARVFGEDEGTADLGERAAERPRAFVPGAIVLRRRG